MRRGEKRGLGKLVGEEQEHRSGESGEHDRVCRVKRKVQKVKTRKVGSWRAKLCS